MTASSSSMNQVFSSGVSMSFIRERIEYSGVSRSTPSGIPTRVSGEPLSTSWLTFSAGSVNSRSPSSPISSTLATPAPSVATGCVSGSASVPVFSPQVQVFGEQLSSLLASPAPLPPSVRIAPLERDPLERGRTTAGFGNHHGVVIVARIGNAWKSALVVAARVSLHARGFIARIVGALAPLGPRSSRSHLRGLASLVLVINPHEQHLVQPARPPPCMICRSRSLSTPRHHS